MWGIFVFTAIQLAIASAHWATHYSFEEGLIYLQLTNNELVALNFSMSGFEGKSGDSLAQINIKQDQSVDVLASPPQNSSMFVYQKGLYAFTGAVDESLSTYDQCGDGVFQLLKYNSSSNFWANASDNMTFSDIDNLSFYRDSTYLTSPTSSEVYVYGGKCGISGDISSRLLSFDMETMSFANITTSTKPQGFYGGVSVWAPSPQQSFVIGGRSTDGWLNMYQVATWNFQSGWSFQSIQQNGTAVSSRTNALVLPMFGVLSDETEQTFLRNYNPKSVFVLGGEASGNSKAPWATLSYENNNWDWQNVNPGFDTGSVLGAALIFDTLVVVNGSSSATNKKRSGSTYHLNLYDTKNNFARVEDLKSNTVKSAGSSSFTDGSVSKTTKILVGTLIPVSALAVLFGVGMFIWRRNVTSKDNASLVGPMDYQLGHYRTRSDQQYSLLGSRPLDLYQQKNDTSSTLEVASIDSWVRKRQEYDATQTRPLNRHSYLASNETLNSHPEEVNDEIDFASVDSYQDQTSEMSRSPISKTMTTPQISKNSSDPQAPPLSTGRIPSSTPLIQMIQSPPTAHFSLETSPKKARLPIRLDQLRSFSYTQTPPQSPTVRKKSKLDPGFISLSEGPGLGGFAESDGESLDENMDVQVLVSSKRKSVLRVMNPDADSTTSEGIRLRTPSK